MDSAISAAFLAIIVAASSLSLKLRILDRFGALAGLAIGVVILAFGGWRFLAILMLFLLLASAATNVGKEHKLATSILWEPFRGWRNVLANGAVATFFAIAEGLVSLEIIAAGFVGAVAASTSDTLATEVGLLSRHRPRLLINLKEQVPPGTSGAVSPFGGFVMIASSLAIGLGAWLVGIQSWSLGKALLLAFAAGTIGCTFDSLLGCTIQANYRCRACGKPTEERSHCGRRAVLVKGSPLVTNHVVNFLATAVGAASAIAICLVWSRIA